jgi:ATP-binding cassette subfamily F protein 3
LQKKQQARNEAKMKKIEKEIDALEQQLAELNVELQKEENYSDYEKLVNIQNEIAKMNEEIENKMQEWEELGS